MEHKYIDHKAFLNMIEGVLFILLGVFCLAYKVQCPAVFNLGSVAFSGKDLLGMAYILAGFFIGHWPVVHFVRPLTMEHKENHKVLAA